MKFTFTAPKPNTVTIKELSAILKLYREDKFVELEGGWQSTCTADPSRGGIFIDVIEPAVLQFKDKYGKIHTGMVKSWSLDSHTLKVDPTIATTNAPIYSDGKASPYNFSLSNLKRCKLISGTMPVAPICPASVRALKQK